MDKIVSNVVRPILFLVFITNYQLPITNYQLFAQDKIVAIVNEDVITQKDLDDFINFSRMQSSRTKIQTMKKDLLKELIEDRLILQEAKKSGIKIDQNRLRAKLAEIKKRYNSNGEFQKGLAQEGLTEADIETRLKEQMLMYEIVEKKIKSGLMVNPAEVTDFYNRNIQDFKTPEVREFESIGIDSQDLAGEISLALKEGKALEDLVNKYQLSVNKLSCRKDGELKKEIEDAVFNLELRSSSEPIEVEEKFYIFRLVNIIPPHQQNLEEVREGIYNFLLEKKMQKEMVRWLDELQKKAFIKVLQD